MQRSTAAADPDRSYSSNIVSFHQRWARHGSGGPTRTNDGFCVDVPTVHVVEPVYPQAASLASLIESQGWTCVCAPDAKEFLARPRRISGGCLLVTQHVANEDCVDLIRRVAERPEMPVIVMGRAECDAPTIVGAMKSGAFDYLSGPVGEDALVRSVRAAIDRSREGVRATLELQRLLGCYKTLTRREREIFVLVISGRLNKQIGHELGISEITVKVHRGQVMAKMKARSVAELVVMGSRLAGDHDTVSIAFPAFAFQRTDS